jgi:predicted RNase H-like HicB family nuclease
MKKKEFQFEVIFTPQEEGGFTAEVPDLPGCISEGDSFEEAEENITEAIELYLETLEERGLPLPNREPMKVVRMQMVVVRKASTHA